MRTGLLIVYACFLFTGCKSKNSIPGSILPEKKMQAVMWDLMRADQFLADYVLNKDASLDRKTESIRLYQKIFLIHKINQETFRKSFSFYRAHPVLLKAIMDSLSRTPVTTLVPAKIIKPQPARDSSQPKRDTLIKDKQRLIKYAEPILFQTYGKKNIRKEKPYIVSFKNGIWTMDGTLPKRYTTGGTFHIVISAIDGKVINIIHYK